MTPEELKELAELEELDRLEKELGVAPKGTWNGPIDNPITKGALRALDYTSGLGRTAAAVGVGDAWDMANSLGITDSAPKMTMKQRNEAVDAALVGNAPSTSEYLDQYGMQDGMGRKALGFAGDVALDPANFVPGVNVANWVGKGLKAGGKAAKSVPAVNKALSKAGDAAHWFNEAASSGMNKLGNKIYDSAFSKIDRAAEIARNAVYKESKTGTKVLAPSQVFKKNKVWGSPEAIERAQFDISKNLLGDRTKLLQEATDAGRTVDFQQALSPLVNELDSVSPNLILKKEAAESYKDVLKPYMEIANRAPGESTILHEFPQPMPKAKPYVPHVDQEIVMDFSPVPYTGNMPPPPNPKLPMKYRGADMHFGEGSAVGPVRDVTPSESVWESVRRVEPGTPGRVGATPIEAGENVTHINNQLSDMAYSAKGKSSLYEEFAKRQAALIREAQEAAVDGFSQGGRSLKEINEELSALISGSDAVAQQASSAAGRNMFTSVDGMLLTNPTILAAKKTADILKAPRTRTGAGMLMMNAAESPYASSLVDNAAKRIPWFLMADKKQENR